MALQSWAAKMIEDLGQRFSINFSANFQAFRPAFRPASQPASRPALLGQLLGKLQLYSHYHDQQHSPFITASLTDQLFYFI